MKPRYSQNMFQHPLSGKKALISSRGLLLSLHTDVFWLDFSLRKLSLVAIAIFQS